MFKIDKEKLMYLLEYIDDYTLNHIKLVLSNKEEDPHFSGILADNLIRCLISINNWCGESIRFHDTYSFMLQRGFNQTDFSLLQKFKNIEQKDFENPHNYKMFLEPDSVNLISKKIDYIIKYINWDLCDIIDNIINKTKSKWHKTPVVAYNLIKCIYQIEKDIGTQTDFSDVDSFLTINHYSKKEIKKFKKLLKTTLKTYEDTVF